MEHTILTTARGEALTGTPWDIYPRPQLRRNSFLCLNGQWDFAMGKEDFCRTIRVPFCPESQLSGIGEHFPEGRPLRYRRKFTLPEGFHKGRVLLHIGAADQHLVCRVNDRLVGKHSGGYEAMTFDITEVLADENELLLICRDDLRDQSQPYGKQTLRRGGMWYTPVSGIWQSVWLESVPDHYIRDLRIDCHGTSVTVSIDPPMDGTVNVLALGEYPLVDGKVTIAPDHPRLWSPEDPFLYDFTVRAGNDLVDSYFALRTLSVETVDGYQRLCLNGKPYFFHGLLDQGYWPDGLFTPAAPECYTDDILAMKKLGFNTLRKHIKVEPEEFYYQCDRLGMVVFQDMVNNGDYGFLRDTALPTAGIQTLCDKNLHRDPKTRHEFLRHMESTVAQLRNHPSILYWTIFNEGWGQFDSDNVYRHLKALDGSRWIDSTSGWFRRKESDVDSRHVYFKPIRLKAGNKPLVLSEFGGYSFKPQGHVFNTEKTYAYGKYADLEAFRQALEQLYREQVIPAAKRGLCAAIYTQVSDVEDETNGLLSYDRKVEKLSPTQMLPIAQALQSALDNE
ncbi:MAG: glycoside hydrolase family 2 [Oscillospiraceae bacterium]|nr:glycoside hydrolase family 2 [Oscillospiraceae bacterium]